MQSLNGFSRVNEGKRTSFLAGPAICSMLVWLLFAATLLGRPANAVALVGPAAPVGLTATAVSSSKINLAWADSANNEDGFKIERKTGAAGTYVQIATVGANVTSFSNISGLSPNTEYFYRVRAYNANGNSAFSNEASATTLLSAPAAPSGLTATAISNTRIDLAWTDNSNNEDGFKIEIKSGPSGTYTEIATISANATSYSSTGLEASSQYFYRVRAFNSVGNSSYSNAANATTLPDPPAAPGSLTATTVSNTQINLTWQDNSNNETGFKIESKLNSAVTYTEIATVGANVTSYSNTGLAINTAYTYRVLAYNAGGNSGYSNTSSATTLPNPPNAPSSLAATVVSNNQINLAWQDNASDELGFIVERKTGVDGTYGVIDTVGPNVKAYASLGLTASTQYFYRVRAYNAGGNSAYSNAANATTQTDPPAAPNNLTATVISNHQINLAWTDNASNEKGFKVELKIDSSGTYAEIATVGANSLSYASKGLNASTHYFYRVRAFNLTGNSDYSNEANATTRPDPPAAPSGLQSAAVSNVQINLTWTDNAANEFGFKIERKLSSSGTYTQIALVGANVTAYLNTGLSANTAYSYRVRAYNTDGHSSFSNEASATTLPNKPATPGGLVATTINKNQIDLAWADSASNEDGFKIERKSNAAANYSEIATVGANVTSYSSMGLSPNTAYSYRIRAYNTGGNSAYSNIAGAKTLPNPPNAPSGLTAAAVSNNRINLAWQDNAGNELGFIIERKTGVSGVYAVIDSVGANVKIYASLGLAGNTQYFYQVRAYNAGGNSAYSDAADATTPIDPPVTPDNLAATATNSGQIDLNWTDNASTEDGFKIELKIGPSGTYVEIATVGANVTSYSSTGLDAGTEYFYRVRAFNLTGNSGYSNEANATTLPDVSATPSDLQAAVVSKNQINLTWTDNAANEDGFKIERKLSSAATYTQIDTVGADVTSYSSTGLTQNTAYSYRVRAYNASGNSAYSNVASATTLPNSPAGPSGLTATTVSNNQIDLSWQDNANNELGFLIRRKTGAGGTYAVIDTVGANVTVYSSLGLTASTQYFYQVRAYNAGGISALSNEVNATTSADPLIAPSGLAATATPGGKVDLTWTDNANNENGFKVERKGTLDGTFGQIATVGPNVTSYSNTSLTVNKTYYYRVRAYNAGGNSAYSNEVNVTTLPKPPKAPGNLTATAVSKNQINLAWADSSNNETGFKIERKASPAGVFGLIATVGANVTSYSNTGLVVDKTYYYRVRAYNAGGHSAYSNEANATTLPALPKAPSNLIATGSKGQINLVWADSSNNEAGFKIERKASPAGTFGLIATVGANVTSYSNTGLGANATYYYRVRAYNASGKSVYSNEANAATLSKPPKAPSNLVATAISSAKINLTWADSSNNEDGFKIERRLSTDTVYTQIATVGAAVTSFSNTGLTTNSQYFYRVRAYNTGGNSSYSNAANATTLPLPPAAPDSLIATPVSNGQINLTWTDHADNEGGFKIERKASAGGTFGQIATVGANVTSYSNTGLPAGKTYYYRVRAFNAGGNSAYSNEVNATTLGGAKIALNSDTDTGTDEMSIPETITLAQNYPNPFSSEAKASVFSRGNPGTMISFTLPAAGKVTLQIYTETGQLMRTLIDGDLPRGRHQMRWSGLNQSGRVAAAGVYLYRLVVQESNGQVLFTQSRVMMMLK
jgi:hypothetical protein